MMELRSQKRLMVFSGSANEPLAEEVARILSVELGGVERSVFANGENGELIHETVVRTFSDRKLEGIADAIGVCSILGRSNGGGQLRGDDLSMG